MNSHYIFKILDENDRLLNFERYKIQKINTSYNKFLKFINSFELNRYEKSYNKTDCKPFKVIAVLTDLVSEKVLFEKSYDDFKKDLENIKQ